MTDYEIKRKELDVATLQYHSIQAQKKAAEVLEQQKLKEIEQLEKELEAIMEQEVPADA